jgi:predicted PurR-regulated permease PerM
VLGIDRRAARITWTVALVAFALYCVYTVRTTLLVLVFAVFFSYVVYPLVERGQRSFGQRVPSDAVVALVFALVLGLIVLAVATFGTPIATEAATLGQELPRLLERGELARRLPLPDILEPFRIRLGELVRNFLEGSQAQALPAARELGLGIVRAAGNLVYIVVVPIFSFLMIRHAPAIDLYLTGLAQREQGLVWARIARDLNTLLARYVRALALLSLATLVVYGMVLTLLAVPFALLLAGISAVLEVIPVFGPLGAAITIITVAAFNGYPHVWWLLAFVVAYRVFQDYMLSPWLMSEGVHVPPILVVFGLLAGDELAGVAGIFLSVPVLAAARIIVSRVRADMATSKAKADQAGSR